MGLRLASMWKDLGDLPSLHLLWQKKRLSPENHLMFPQSEFSEDE